MHQIKSTLKGTNTITTEAEDRISEMEDRMVKIYNAERIKEKRIKRNEDNLRDLWNNVKAPTFELEEIIVENFPKMGKEISTQVQETQRVPNKINPG